MNWIKSLITLAVVLSAVVLVGCSTVKGLGQDIESASDATRDAISGEE